MNPSILSHLDQVKSDLKSDKATRRKEGIKLLNTLLDSPDYLRALDQQTVRLSPKDPVPAASWPGLCSVLSGYVTDEIKASSTKKRGPEASLSKTFRKLIQLAEDERRSGRKGLLVRRAGKVFIHIKEVLGLLGPAGLSSPIGQDYGTVLRSHMLALPQYCACSSASIFQELLDVYYSRLETRPLDRSEDTYRAMATIQALLARFPGDMHPAFQGDTVVFFSESLAPRLNALREDSRLTSAALSGINAFLLVNGTDVASQCPKLHTAWHAMVLRALTSGRDPKLREAAITYLRLQLRLGAVCRSGGRPGAGAAGAAGEEAGVAGWLGALLEWFEREVQQPGFRWGEDSREGRLVVSRQHHALLQLGAALYYHSYAEGSHSRQQQRQQQSEEEGVHVKARHGVRVIDSDSGSDEEVPLPASKRRKKERWAGQPSAWCPVAAQLLLSYGRCLGTDLLLEWAAELRAGLGRLFPSPQQAALVMDDSDPDGTLWALRFAHALALAWPLHLTAAACAAGSPAKAELTRSQDLWKAIWQAVHAHVLGPHVPLATLEAAATALGAIARLQLAPLPPGFHTFWGLPLLEQPPSQPLLAFVADALDSGDHQGAEGTGWQEGVLRWLASSTVAAATSATTGLAAFCSVLKLPLLPAKAPSTSTSTRSSSSLPDGTSGQSEGQSAGRQPVWAPLGVVGGEGRGVAGPVWRWWWAGDAGSLELDRQLEELTRGEMLLRARTAAARRRQLQAKWRRSRGRGHLQRLGPWSAAADLQEAAAAALGDLLEDVLRQPPSPQPFMHAQQHPTRLAQLLTACTIAVSAITSAAAASTAAAAEAEPGTPSAAGRQRAQQGQRRLAGANAGAGAPESPLVIAPCWAPEGPLGSRLLQALHRCGDLLAEGARAPAGLLGAELDRLGELAEALEAYWQALGRKDMADGLLRCMGEVQELFLRASQVAPAAALTQATGALGSGSLARGADLTGTAAEAFFDDDLDVGGAAPVASARGSAGPTLSAPSSAALVIACKARCITLLSLLGPLQPRNGAHAVVHWLQHRGADEAPLPEELHVALVEALCSCAVHALRDQPAVPQRAQQAEQHDSGGSSSGSEEMALHIAAAAVQQLGQAEGLLGWAKFHNGRQEIAMAQARKLARALQGHRGSPQGQDALLALVQLVDDCLALCEAAEAGRQDKLTSWQMRTELGRTVAALFDIDIKLFGEELLDPCMQTITNLLADDRYPARLVGGSLVHVILDKWSNSKAVFSSLKGLLSLRSTAVRDKAENVEESMESSLIILGECSVACGAVELDSLFLMCAHAAIETGHLPLACGTLDWVSAELGYASRHAYAAWHLPPLLYAMFSAGFTVTHLTLSCVAPTPEGATDLAAFLASLAPQLAAVLVFGQKGGELADLAAALHTT
ncbi:hypothetical protein N2152v2_006167, partial [Parachlorella kessleri]